ncbi:MAG TPA: type II toxin-antitoxin system Phd/YefM family antitoxin [Candidatus Limnocylindrales bacterium]|nr:type II toxin-antitoxin system Phd/YefM family antitoxin [Candidatus Limnocylindrales bacterium]
MASVPKSELKAKALQYFRQVEKTGQELIVTDRGKPVLKIVPYRDEPKVATQSLKGSVIAYSDPTDPIGVDDWESLQ